MLTASYAKNSTLKDLSDRVGRDVTLVGLFNMCEYSTGSRPEFNKFLWYIGIEDFYIYNYCVAMIFPIKGCCLAQSIIFFKKTAIYNLVYQ